MGESLGRATSSRAAEAPLPSQAAGVGFLPALSAPMGVLRKEHDPQALEGTAPGPRGPG